MELIVVSIGGNDLHFGSKLSRCFSQFVKLLGHAIQPLISSSPCKDELHPGLGLEGPGGLPHESGELATAGRSVEDAIEKVKDVMAEPGIRDDGYTLVLQSYPSPVTDDVWPTTPGANLLFDLVARGCPMRLDDAAWARDVLVPAINDEWARVARRQGIAFLDLAAAAKEREVCSRNHTGRDEWIRGLYMDPLQMLIWAGAFSVPEIANRSLSIIQESFHPNALYHRQVGRCLASLFDRYHPTLGSGAAKQGRCVSNSAWNLEFKP